MKALRSLSWIFAVGSAFGQSGWFVAGRPDPCWLATASTHVLIAARTHGLHWDVDRWIYGSGPVEMTMVCPSFRTTQGGSAIHVSVPSAGTPLAVFAIQTGTAVSGEPIFRCLAANSPEDSAAALEIVRNLRSGRTVARGVLQADGGKPLGGVPVSISSDRALQTVVTRPDGLWEVLGLAPGLYRADASVDGYRRRERRAWTFRMPPSGCVTPDLTMEHYQFREYAAEQIEALRAYAMAAVDVTMDLFARPRR